MGRKSAADLEEAIKKVRGLELHGKALRLNFSYRNTRCRETLQLPLTAKNIEYAKGLLATIKHQIKTRVFDYAEHFPDSPNARRFGSVDTRVTISEITQLWFKSKIELTQPVRRRYQTVINRMDETIGRHVAATLLKSEVEQFRNSLVLDLSPATANYHISMMRQVLAFAFENKYISENPVNWVKRFKVEKSPPDPLTVEEFDTILDKGCLSDFDRNWYTVAVWTGLRTGELCALAWEDVDLEKRRATVRRNVDEDGRFKLPKNGKVRTVVLLPPALEALQSQLTITGNGKAFTAKVALNELNRTREDTITVIFPPSVQAKKHKVGKTYTPNNRAKNWANVLNRAEIRHRRQYQTRHTFACWALTVHGNPVFVANQMGHRDFTEIVEVYGKWMPEETEFEVDKIWEFYTQKFPNNAPNKNKDSL